MRVLSHEEMTNVSGGGLGKWIKKNATVITAVASVVAVAGVALVATGIAAPVGGVMIVVGAGVGATVANI